MKLALVNSSWQLGGAETVAQDLLEGCRAAGHATRLYVAYGKTYPARDDLAPLYPRPLSRIYHTRLNPIVERAAPRAAWMNRSFRRIGEGDADVVHVHNFHGDYATVDSLAHVARRKPLVWTFHGHWGVTGGCDHPLDCTRFERECGDCPRLGVWPLGRVDDTAGQLKAKLRTTGGLELDVVAPSRFIRERIERSQVGRRWRVHHIPNGICTRTFSARRKHDPAFRRETGIDPSAVSVLVVNRRFRDPEKGFQTVLNALKEVAQEGVRLQVVLAGADSDWAARQLDFGVGVSSRGYITSRPAMAALYEAADIFLFASAAETFPCVVLEAMASGCCVVTTPTSGVTEQIDDGSTGLMAADMGADALARVLGAALTAAQLRRSIGAAAREYVERTFSLDAFIRRHLELYAQVAAAPRRGVLESPARA